MILKPDSILFFLPKNMETRQLLIFDSLRFTIEIIDSNWQDLNNSLLECSREQKVLPFSKTFSNVWSIIDNTQRFIAIYKSLLTSDSQFHILDPITHISSFRNTFAHLNERIDESLLKNRTPFYGALTWEYLNDFNESVESFVAISGIYFGSEHKVNFDKYSISDRKIFNIKLETVNHASKRDLELDRLMVDFIKIVDTFENDLQIKLEKMGAERYNWLLQRDITIKLVNDKKE